jgi:biopolymer transport protein ExbD
MKCLLEVCLIATLAIAPSVLGQSALTAPETSDPGLMLVRRTGPIESEAQAMQKGISVELPVTGHARPVPAADNEDAWIVTVTADSRIYFGADPVTPAALLDAMKSRPRNREQKLYIKADARVLFSHVATVINAGRVVGFEAPVLLTSQPETAASGTVVPPKGLEVLVGPALPPGTVATVVRVLNSGRQRPSLTINSDEISWTALEDTLRQHFQKGDERVILLKADAHVAFAHVAQVIDVCRSTGAQVVLAAPEL